MEYRKKNIFGVEIVAQSEEEIARVTQALRFMHTKEEKLFAYFKKLKAILVYSKKTGYDNLLFPKERVYVCQTRTVLDSTKAYLSSLFLHETRHLLQFEKKKSWHGDKAEGDAYRFQRRFLKKHGAPEEVLWLDKVYKEKWWVFTDKKSGKKQLISPQDRTFQKFVERYLSGNLV